MIDWMDFELRRWQPIGGRRSGAAEGTAASLTNAPKRYGIALADDVIADVNPTDDGGR